MESIYRYIVRMRDEQPKLPYLFQDGRAGMSDVSIAIRGSDLPYSDRKMKAAEACRFIEQSLQGMDNTQELLSFFASHRIITYLTEFTERMRLLLTTDTVDSQGLYELGYRWATDSPHDDLVRAGMIILGNYENDIVTNVLRTLGYHSALSVYAIAASAPIYRRNPFLFDMCRNTSGYGKLIALIALEPVTSFQQEWLFTEGLSHCALRNLAASQIMQKPDMRDYLARLEMDKKTYTQSAKLIAHTLLDPDPSILHSHPVFFERFIANSPASAEQFIEHSALLAIAAAGVGDDSQTRIVQSVLDSPKWKTVVCDQMFTPVEDNRLILRGLETLPSPPSFQSLMRILMRDPFDSALLEYLEKHPEEYWGPLVSYNVQAFTDSPIFSGATDIPDEYLAAPQFHADLWPAAALRMMRAAKEYDEDFCLLCLRGRTTSVRKEAIAALNVNRYRWADGVTQALQTALDEEPVQEIRQQILALLGNSEERDVNGIASEHTGDQQIHHPNVIRFPEK